MYDTPGLSPGIESTNGLLYIYGGKMDELNPVVSDQIERYNPVTGTSI